jgi:Flp pilus assembly protein TadD
LVLEKLPLLALSAASCVATVVAQREAIQSTESFSLPLRLGNALVTCMVYLCQMVWPAGLAVFYPYPHDGLPAWEVALAGTLVAGFSVVVWKERRTRPWLLIGWLWYLLLLLPVVGIIQVGRQAHADRYTYLPQIGIYVAVTWWVAEWRVSRVVLGSLMGGVLAVLMVCAWKQTAYWQDSETLLTHTLVCTTDNDATHNNLGTFLVQEGRVDEAISHFQKALEIRPDYAEAQCNLGLALFQKGRVDDAIAQYQKALQIKPDFAEAHFNLGNALLQKGKADEAVTHFQTALQIGPANPSIQNNLAWLLATSPKASLRNGNKAVELARQANALTGGENPIILRTLAAAFAEAGQFDDARRNIQKAIDLAPAAGQEDLLEQLNKELKRYEAGLPLHNGPRRKK